MEEIHARLIYPPSLVNVPVIHQLIRTFEVTVNIRGAEITDEHGWLDIQLSGEKQVLQDAISWLEAQGIHVEIIDK